MDASVQEAWDRIELWLAFKCREALNKDNFDGARVFATCSIEIESILIQHGYKTGHDRFL